MPKTVLDSKKTIAQSRWAWVLCAGLGPKKGLVDHKLDVKQPKAISRGLGIGPTAQGNTGPAWKLARGAREAQSWVDFNFVHG
ncbi:hypothetical protein ACFXTO_026133 [Malus domestica]